MKRTAKTKGTNIRFVRSFNSLGNPFLKITNSAKKPAIKKNNSIRKKWMKFSSHRFTGSPLYSPENHKYLSAGIKKMQTCSPKPSNMAIARTKSSP